jgi:hypothetical protein
LNVKSRFYLHPDLIEKAKIEAVTQGRMRYSDLMENNLSHAFHELVGVKDYKDLEKRFGNITKSFSPSKRGRPWNKEPSERKPLTMYLSSITTNQIDRYSKLLNVSKSDVIELALKITYATQNNGMTLFKIESGIKFTDNDYVLLKTIMKTCGCGSVSEFLNVCKNDRISKEIKKVVQEDRMTSSLSEGYFRDFLKRHKRVHFKWFEESGNKKLTIYVLDGHPRTTIVFGTYSSWIEAANDSELRNKIERFRPAY